MKRFLLIPLGLAVGGCAVGPEYVVPEVVGLPTTYADIEADAPVDLTQWWTRLNDPKLTALVEEALLRSPDVEEALARVLESRALLAAARGERLPQVDATAGYSRSRQSENLDGFAGLAGGEGADGAGGGGGFSFETDLWQAGLGAAWELDVFGRLTRRVQAAGRQFEAEQFDLADIRVTLAADVATTYISVRELQNRLGIARENVGIQQRSLELAQARFDGGLTTELDVAQAIADLQQTRASLPDLQRQLALARNRLAVLVGEAPGFADDDVTPPQPLPVADLSIAVGVPADLLRRRPDIRRAERELAAAVAEVGAAEADLYPRLSLAGTFGLAAGDLDDLFDWDSRTFDVGPSVMWPIFQGGTLRALVTAADARREQELANYRRTVLVAVREASDAVTSLSLNRDRRDVLLQSQAAATRAFELADAQYREGLIEFDRVLQAQQTLFVTQDALAIAESTIATNLVELFRALGGGWRPPGDPATTSGS